MHIHMYLCTQEILNTCNKNTLKCTDVHTYKEKLNTCNTNTYIHTYICTCKKYCICEIKNRHPKTLKWLHWIEESSGFRTQEVWSQPLHKLLNSQCTYIHTHVHSTHLRSQYIPTYILSAYLRTQIIPMYSDLSIKVLWITCDPKHT
jgi:hypothetical protein